MDDQGGLNKTFGDRGYCEDLLPIENESRNWSTLNFFTLWMGSVHNVPNYVMVGSFFILGLTPLQILFSIIVSSFVIALMMVVNGAAGTKYGIPFTMLLRASYGVRGALFPGVLRGIIAAIMWFSLQCYAGSLALLILIGKIYPGFLQLGGDFSFLGIDLPGLISFVLFWMINVLIGYGGASVFNKFTAILNPLIYIVFFGMTIWIVSKVGVNSIINYNPVSEPLYKDNYNIVILIGIILNSVVAVWAAPLVNAADFSRNAKNYRSQVIGQVAGLLLSYALFALASVFVLCGASIYYGTQTWNILDIIQKWDGLFVSLFSIVVILMTTVSTNVAGNIMPAGLQLSGIFPRHVSYKRGILIASLIALLLCPWKLMEDEESIYSFLGFIGGMLGPILGVMVAHYFVGCKTKVNLSSLYVEKGVYSYYTSGINLTAFAVTITACIISILLPHLEYFAIIEKLSWIIGFSSSFILYALFSFRGVTIEQRKTNRSTPQINECI